MDNFKIERNGADGFCVVKKKSENTTSNKFYSHTTFFILYN